MIDYDKIAARSYRAIADAGADATLRITTSSTGTPWNPASGNTEDHEVKAVVVDYSQRDIDGTIIRQSDKRALISAHGLSITPNSQGSLVMPDGTWNIVRVNTIAPAGIPVVYDLQVRR